MNVVGLERCPSDIRLDESNSIELIALLAATFYSFLLPLKATLSLVDTLFFFGLFGFYGYLSSKSHVEAPELEEGPAQAIARMTKNRRRTAIAALFLFSAAAICLAAEPFAESLLSTGRELHIEEFLLVQWLAPLASEAPEFIVAILFALHGRPEVGLRALISSKVNQWTLLVGMLPAAFSLSSGSLHPMPLDPRQVEEIFLTSAQSLFGLAILMNLVFSFWEALILCGLFFAQICFPQAMARYTFAGIYLAASLYLMISQSHRRSQFRRMIARVLG